MGMETSSEGIGYEISWPCKTLASIIGLLLPMVSKGPFSFFEWLREESSDFSNFWYTTS